MKDFPLHLKYLKAVGKQRLKTTNPEDLQNEEGGQNDMVSRLQHEMELMKHVKRSDTLTGSPSKLVAPENLLNFHKELDEIYNYRPKWYLTENYKHLTHFIIIPFSK